MNRNSQWIAAGLVVVLAGSVGWITVDRDTSSREDASAKTHVLANIASRWEAVDAMPVTENLSDFLPNTVYSQDGDTAAPFGPGVIEGRVISVEEGAAYVVHDGDGATGVEVPFSDENAVWRVAVLEIAVDKSVGTIKVGDTARFGIAFDGGLDTAEAMRGLSSLGTVVIPASKPGFFKFDPSLYQVGLSGALLGSLDSKGNIRFPLLGESEDAFLSGISSFSELAHESKKPKHLVKVTAKGNAVVRAEG